MKVLLVRCVHETEPYTKEILGACLGEVGAISGQRLGMLSLSTELGASDSLDSEDSAWRLMRPPWMVKGGIKDKKEKYSDCDAEVGYGFKLVEHLVVALRAAPTSAEQHKIAFPIQELLQLLNNVAEDSLAETINVVDNQNRPPMCSWLREKLESAGVIESVEPFWHSDFREVRCKTSMIFPLFMVALTLY